MALVGKARRATHSNLRQITQQQAKNSALQCDGHIPSVEGERKALRNVLAAIVGGGALLAGENTAQDTDCATSLGPRHPCHPWCLLPWLRRYMRELWFLQ